MQKSWVRTGAVEMARPDGLLISTTRYYSLRGTLVAFAKIERCRVYGQREYVDAGG